jgi:hypothetical protein
MNACGNNILCKIEATIRSVGGDLASLFDTAIDYFIPVLVLALVIFVIAQGFQRVRHGDTWQGMIGWLWSHWILLVIILLFGAGVMIALVRAFPDVFDRAGDVVNGFLGTQ